MERLYKFLLTIVVIFVLTFTSYKFTIRLLSDMIETKAIETSLSIYDIEKEQLEAIKNTLDETEKNIIKDIINKHIKDVLNTNNIKDLAKSKDIDAIKNFIKQELNEEEIKQLKSIYIKHKDKIDDIIKN